MNSRPIKDPRSLHPKPWKQWAAESETYPARPLLHLRRTALKLSIKKYSLVDLFASNSYCSFALDVSKDGKGYQILEKNEPFLEKKRRIVSTMMEQMKA
ncbi:hypothetical protein AC579_9472 [Pseudocercospora musae]|uniref:Uncharacterized protein n=1 Tax=Pseudocercospora musae TaxID=113226 RepID=A0A139I9V3_9PEZI|nr:hypothetical protein AC579_9472 [Pseudocercospora musae]